MKPIGYAALAVTGAFIFSKIATASAATRLNIILGKVEIANGGLQLTLIAQNPTPISYTVDSIVGTVSVNGSYIANVSSFVPALVKRNSEVLVPINVRITLFDVLTNIDDMLKGISTHVVVFNLKGTVNVDSIVVPLDLTYKVL